MVNILEHLKKQVTLKHLNDPKNSLFDMGLTETEVAGVLGIRRRPNDAFEQQLNDFKAQFIEGDEIWYYSHELQFLAGCGGYALIRDGALVATLNTWRS